MSLENKMNLKDYIIDVPDWPKEGVVFKDISPLLADVNAMTTATLLMRGLVENNPSYIVGIESRGFVVGSALSMVKDIPFLMVRKPNSAYPGKLLYQKYNLASNTLIEQSITYSYFYGYNNIWKWLPIQF